MGLSVDKATRTAFFEKHGAISRGMATAVSPELVVVDFSAVLRQSFPAIGPGPKTPADLAHEVVRKYITPHTTARCIVVAFDSYSAVDLHRLRIEMHTTSRHRKATEDELAMTDETKHIVVNGRIYTRGQHPYPDAEVDGWKMDVKVLPERAVANKKGKLRIYDLVLEAMVREVSQHVAQPMTAAAEGRRVVFDTPASYDDEASVITVHQTGEVVRVESEPRVAGIGRHGEGDQKCAAYLCQHRDAVAVWHTIDYDAVAQSMVLDLGNVHIAYPAPRKDKDRKPQLVAMGKLPLGSAAAFAMVRDGGDYNRSAKLFNVHSAQLLGALGSAPSVLTIEGGRVVVDQESLFGFIHHGRSEKQRKRKLFHLEGSDAVGEYYLSKASAQVHSAGRKVVHGFPSSAQFHRSIHEATRTVAYWLFAATPDSTTRPTMDLDGIVWETDACTADSL
jgi:hypothetical protein